MHYRQIPRWRLQVAALIIEEHMGLENRQHSGFFHPTEEEALIWRHAPILQSGHQPLMRRRVARGDDDNAQDAFLARALCQLLVFQRANV